jgi:GAF domain-containing protein
MQTEILISTLNMLAKALAGITLHPSALFTVEYETITLLSMSNLGNELNQESIFKQITVKADHLERKLNGDGQIFNISRDTITIPSLFDLASRFAFQNVAFYKLANKTGIHAFIMIGDNREQSLTRASLQPYENIIQLAKTILEQDETIEQINHKSLGSETITDLSQVVATSGNLAGVFSFLHERIQRVIGGNNLAIALYDENTQSIRIPYLFEDGIVSALESFPLGEGLTSIIIHTKQPLMLVKNVEEQAETLGAKTVGKPAKSWLGVPLIVNQKAIGSIILQDLENENAFSNSDLLRLTTIAQQVAGFVYAAGIIDDMHRQLLQVQTATEIAREISSALNLDELLLKAVDLIRDRFNFYHAAIFLIEPGGNNAVIREATGEAGAQLKRIGHKLAVGSKSIVGFVAGQGDPLVVNDITKDATHLPNPMLPDTRAEAAIPLKIGERILGVLDVQSTIPYSFSSNDINTFQTLADQLAIAVNNTELFAEIQEHLSQHRLLHHITTSAASGTTLEEALNSAVKGLQVTLGGDRVSILLADEERKKLTVKASVGYAESASAINIPFGSGITGWVAAHRKSLRVNDVTQDARYILVSSNTRSELAIPLIFRNDILGVLNVESEQIGAYSENDEEMLGTLAGSLAAIIANARLVDQIRKQAERERLLNEVSSKIRRSTDMQTILNTTIQELHRVTGARKTQISIGIPAKEPEDYKTEPPNSREE